MTRQEARQIAIEVVRRYGLTPEEYIEARDDYRNKLHLVAVAAGTEIETLTEELED